MNINANGLQDVLRSYYFMHILDRYIFNLQHSILIAINKLYLNRIAQWSRRLQRISHLKTKKKQTKFKNAKGLTSQLCAAGLIANNKKKRPLSKYWFNKFLRRTHTHKPLLNVLSFCQLISNISDSPQQRTKKSRDLLRLNVQDDDYFFKLNRMLARELWYDHSLCICI